MLNRYPTTVQQDLNLLKNNKLSDIERCCVRYRMCEKELCRFFINSSNFILEMMDLDAEKAQAKASSLPK
jgi:hypothetical protein